MKTRQTNKILIGLGVTAGVLLLTKGFSGQWNPLKVQLFNPPPPGADPLSLPPIPSAVDLAPMWAVSVVLMNESLPPVGGTVRISYAMNPTMLPPGHTESGASYGSLLWVSPDGRRVIVRPQSSAIGPFQAGGNVYANVYYGSS